MELNHTEPMPAISPPFQDELGSLIRQWQSTHTLSVAEIQRLQRVQDAGGSELDLQEEFANILAARELAVQPLQKDKLRARIKQNRDSGRSAPTWD